MTVKELKEKLDTIPDNYIVYGEGYTEIAFMIHYVLIEESFEDSKENITKAIILSYTDS